MGGCRCSYKDCKNTTKTTENVHFFHYPVKHKERCKIWIENANKPQFCDLEEDQLRNKVICEHHFEDRWFPNSQKKRLLQGAVPTLDADAEDKPVVPEEAPLYLSAQLQDVQVLPANADGTIFVLDTDTMFSRSQKVESYIYKNGIIVPASTKQTKRMPIPSKPSTSTSNSALFSSYRDENSETVSRTHDEEQNNIADHTDYKDIIKKETPDYQEHIINRSILQRFEHEVGEEHYVHQPPENHCEGSNSQRKAGPRSGNMKNINSKGVMDKTVGRNYLRQIKQHSRDIASIKRMLKQKVLGENKPDTNALLNSLKEQLPSTFFTILNLNMNNKCDLTDDDVDFFTTIHKTSPEVYQLLIDKYKWNLPCVDIVESPME